MNPTPDAPDDDPFLWLEQVEGSAAVGWVEAETVLTLARFGGAGFARDRDTLAAMWDRDDKIPFVTRRGGEVYNFWVDAHAKRGLWRRAPWSSYRDGEPAWDVLLDLDALAAAEGEDWTWAGAAMRPGDRRHALLKLSRGGGDACVLREYDLEAKAFVDGGFVAPEAKQSAEWVDADTLLLCSAHGEGQATRSGYARTARLWKRGDPFEAAQSVFEGEESDISVFAGLDRSVTPPRWVFGRRTSFFAYDLWVGDLSSRAQIDAPGDADKDVHGDWLLVKPRSAWTRGDVTYPAGALLAAPLARPGEFTTLFEPGETRALEDYTWIGRKLALSMLDDLAPAFDLLTPEESWRRERLDGVPQVGVVGIGRLDAYNEESDGSTLAYVQDPLTPMEMRLFDLSGEPTAPTVLRRTPALFDASGLIVTRHDATAEDGERIPYVQVGPPHEDGEALVHLYGYGGFEVSERPVYRSALGKLWLERGGVSVIANIRGGGEFGPRWHQAGVREKKRIAQDDFAAVAADLVRRGVTKPARIAAEGGSNGGLLIANMLTRHPEKFGALLCTIPLIDMRRYTKLLAGASWIEEYGDPDKPEDWAFLQQISAYHQAAPGRRYPQILIATTRRDDRVHPGHARKFAAKLKAMGYEAYFYEPAAGGHGYGKDNFERAGFTALGLGFLWETIGGPFV
jgi:prolyl oligopeptidase